MEDKEKIKNTAKGLKLLEERGLVERHGDNYGLTQKFNQLLEKYFSSYSNEFFSTPDEAHLRLLIRIVDNCEPPPTQEEIAYMVPALDGLFNIVCKSMSEKRKPVDEKQLYKFFEEKYKERHR